MTAEVEVGVPRTMRVARFLGRGRIELEERPVPVPAADEILVRVDGCALCGTDRGAYLHGSDVTPGHEVAGRVVAAGAEAAVAPGTPGVVYLVDFCGTCYCCRAGWTNMCLRKRRMYGFTAPGGYAAYVCVSAPCFVPVGDAIPLRLAPALLDLYGTAKHALRRGGIGPSSSVAVVGCGPIGLGAVEVAGALGARPVVGIDVAPDRLALAARLGAEVVDGSAGDPVGAARARCPDGFEIVIEAAGLLTTQAQAIALCAPAGRVVFVAHNREPLALRTLEDLIQRELALLGSEYFPLDDLGETRALVESGRLDPARALTHEFPLERIGEAFEAFMGGVGGKVVVRP